MTDDTYTDALLDMEYLEVMMDALGLEDWSAAVSAFGAGAEQELSMLRQPALSVQERAMYAHRLKGLCLNVGAMRMSEQARRLEFASDEEAGPLVTGLAASLSPTMMSLNSAIKARWG